MTRREFFGWTPSETQLHYNPAGEHVGTTFIERESRISDQDRAELLALALYDRQVCQCGYHPLIADDKANGFEPGFRICPVCAGIDKQNRMLADRDKKAVAPDAAPGISRPSDGRHAHMRLLTPEEAEQAAAALKSRKKKRGSNAE